MNLREEKNFLNLPCVTVIKDLRRSSSSNNQPSGFDLRKRATVVVAVMVLIEEVLMLDEIE